MSNVLSFPEKPVNPDLINIEATPDGIRLTLAEPAGTLLLSLHEAIRQLDSGEFDNSLADGLQMISQLQRAVVRGWFAPTAEQRAMMWRWTIACLFLLEQAEANGTCEIANEDGGTDLAVIYSGKNGGMAVYPASERMSLATHIEGIAIQKYGAVTGLERALLLYEGMAEVPPAGGPLRLSQWGREALTMLHDDFIRMLNTEGMPAEPTAH